MPFLARQGVLEPSLGRPMSHDLKAIVGGKHKARFSRYRDGNFFSVVKVADRMYRFAIPIEDAEGTTFFAECKAMALRRWLRKALADKTL